jgi:hypothetical protein
MAREIAAASPSVVSRCAPGSIRLLISAAKVCRSLLKQPEVNTPTPEFRVPPSSLARLSQSLMP